MHRPSHTRAHPVLPVAPMPVLPVAPMAVLPVLPVAPVAVLPPLRAPGASVAPQPHSQNQWPGLHRLKRFIGKMFFCGLQCIPSQHNTPTSAGKETP